jgi:hypothetical protein
VRNEWRCRPLTDRDDARNRHDQVSLNLVVPPSDQEKQREASAHRGIAFQGGTSDLLVVRERDPTAPGNLGQPVFVRRSCVKVVVVAFDLVACRA